MRTLAWISRVALFVTAQGVRQEAKNMLDDTTVSGQCTKVMATFLCKTFVDWAGNEDCIRKLSQPPIDDASCKAVVLKHETVGDAVVAQTTVDHHPRAPNAAFRAAMNVFAKTEDTAQEADTEQASEEEEQAVTTNADTEQQSAEDVPAAKDTSPLIQAFYADRLTDGSADWEQCIIMCEDFKEEPKSPTGVCDTIRSLEDCRTAQTQIVHEHAESTVLSLAKVRTVFKGTKNFGCQVVHRVKNDDRMVWLQEGMLKYNNVCGLYQTDS